MSSLTCGEAPPTEAATEEAPTEVAEATEASPEAKEARFDFIKTFAGKIDNKYGIHLKIQAEDGEISGTYFYDNVGIDLRLRGSLASDSTLLLEEFDEKSNQTGTWKGKLLNGSKLTGDWAKPDGSKAKPFMLLVTSDSYDAFKRDISDEKYASFNGTYYNAPEFDSESNSDESYTRAFGQVTIKYLDNNEFDFAIETADLDDDCEGYIKGVAQIKPDGSIVYSGKGCERLEFQFERSRLKVLEKRCDFHGVKCPFAGRYRK